MNPNFVWQDRELRFDSGRHGTSLKDLTLRRGEVLIDSINSVEDTKGNNGERGTFEVTNLRVIWTSHKRPRTNLSIGYKCITNVLVKATQSRLRGACQALHIHGKKPEEQVKHNNKDDSRRFEFIFTSLVKASPRLFTTMQAVHRAYSTTMLFRELKLRGAIIKDRELILLPGEEVYNKIDGVWNLSSEQGNLGVFFITNVRIVWHARLAENFNVSVPYMQIRCLRVCDSKFGRAFVIESTVSSGGYVLGFRIDPVERLHETFKEVQSLHQIFSVNPIFGVEHRVEEQPEPLDALRERRKHDDIEIVGDEDDDIDPTAVYFAEPQKQGDRAPAFSEELGLAVEALPSGLTIARLWNVV